MDAEHLAFKDGSFDTVVSTLGTCTFPDPVEALREMRRVCRPGGTVLLLEHGRSNRAAPRRLARSPCSQVGSSSRLLVESRAPGQFAQGRLTTARCYP